MFKALVCLLTRSTEKNFQIYNSILGLLEVFNFLNHEQNFLSVQRNKRTLNFQQHNNDK